eukprot:TRINITY_DN6515_c0_g1_i8.p1 TRINITY_DN6515_c0_g1~~TRINITY_DN6515_c0_g1_i8.p1  ORF type:complete len:645 (+),score=158.69 TRINITY_DN6515_c0_g1_i8:60-1937(+)
MRIQVSCNSTLETTDRTWTETVFVGHNPKALHKNPLAFQNKLMTNYFNKQILPSVIEDFIALKENNDPHEFRFVVASKYAQIPEKEPDHPASEFDCVFDPHLEFFDTLPTPVRFLKVYYSKLPEKFAAEMCKYLLSYKEQAFIPPPILFMLGVIHDIGLEVPVDHALALKYYLESKKGKYPYAFYTLFDIYSRCYETYGVERNQTFALKQMVKLVLYSIYCSDSWISPNFIGDGAFGYLSVGYAHLDIYPFSCEYAKKIAESSKNPIKRKIMQYILTVDKEDGKEQLKALEEATALCDDPFLLVKVTDIHLIGSGPIIKNQEKARKYLIKLLDSKKDTCFKYYGYELLGYLYDVKGEYEQALKCYGIGAKYGLIYSMKKVGTAHALGLAMKPDFGVGEEMLIKAATLGSNDAYLSLLELYIYLKELKDKAWKFYEAVLPLVPMFSFFEQDCYQLYKAMMMEKGMGVPVNYPGAIMVYSTLPKKDFPVALYRLGKVYKKSNNIIQAQQYFEDCYHNYMNIIKNWLQPHSSTYIRIAKLYLAGKGCDKNILRGEEMLKKAVNMKCCSTIPCLIRKKKAMIILDKLKDSAEAMEVEEVNAKNSSKEEVKDIIPKEDLNSSAMQQSHNS